MVLGCSDAYWEHHILPAHFRVTEPLAPSSHHRLPTIQMPKVEVATHRARRVAAGFRVQSASSCVCFVTRRTERTPVWKQSPQAQPTLTPTPKPRQRHGSPRLESRLRKQSKLFPPPFVSPLVSLPAPMASRASSPCRHRAVFDDEKIPCNTKPTKSQPCYGWAHRLRALHLPPTRLIPSKHRSFCTWSPDQDSPRRWPPQSCQGHEKAPKEDRLAGPCGSSPATACSREGI
ncbi:hypothetical protein BGZ61DRAFT_46684 [Ilyonectria robusta]|uniref:uncharacterized protein n=1 Tax=Ilyonectria robusta TaxID=1079257 RepID=UPI001E8CE81A|nr:uncharacterized protein BGZ61DRAFT_46684 [Ilyonectria robusta]KAH8686840.1 hypothetical protein BGZ61DRAFT_46684 [Ilyonectria robusta]